MSGYIKLDRRLFEHFLWNTDEPFTKAMAWIDLIQMASYKNERTLYKGRPVDRKRGSVYASVLWLSDRWKWSRGKTIRFLKLLEAEGMIRQNSTTDGTTLTIENYDVYQDGGTTNRTTDDTSTVQPAVHILNKEKKEKKEKNNSIVENVISFLNATTGKNYSSKSDANRKLINARLNEGYTEDDFYKVISNKDTDWKGTEYEQYLRPNTLFSKKHFDDYLNSTPIKRSSGNPFLDILETMND